MMTTLDDYIARAVGTPIDEGKDPAASKAAPPARDSGEEPSMSLWADIATAQPDGKGGFTLTMIAGGRPIGEAWATAEGMERMIWIAQEEERCFELLLPLRDLAPSCAQHGLSTDELGWSLDNYACDPGDRLLPFMLGGWHEEHADYCIALSVDVIGGAAIVWGYPPGRIGHDGFWEVAHATS